MQCAMVPAQFALVPMQCALILVQCREANLTLAHLAIPIFHCKVSGEHLAGMH